MPTQIKPQSPTENVPVLTKQERTEVVSNFSIKGIFLRKELKMNTKEDEIDPNALPRESFSEEDLLKFWNLYVRDLQEKGTRLQASIFSVCKPKLKGTVIHLELSSQVSKSEVLRDEEKILNYLKKSLKNYDLSLDVTVNEESAKKILITPDEKFEYLTTLNPLLSDFRKEFELNISF